MFGQITDLPSLRTYEEAVAHYESIVPIRGSDNVRPICATTNGRRKKHMTIRKYVDGSVACRLYDTDVVTFEPDGDVVFRNGGWATATTHGFANGILRDGVIYFGTRQNRTEITVIGGGAHIMDGNDFFRLRKDNEGRYVAVNPPIQYEYYARRKVLTAKRKPVLAFQKHCLAMAKLADPEQYYYGNDASSIALKRIAYHSRYTKTAYNIMSDPTMENWGELVQGILGDASTSSYIYGRGREYRFRDTLIKEFISDVIKHTFADEVFEKQEVSRKTFNGNDKYFD